MARYNKTLVTNFPFDSREEYEEFNQEIVEGMIRRCMTQAEYNRLIVTLGKIAEVEDWASQGKLDSVQTEQVRRFTEKRDELRTKRQVFQSMHNLCRQMGKNDFIAWYAKQADYDPKLLEEFMISEQEIPQMLPWSERARVWIIETLKDGNPYPAKEIKQKAVSEGLIANTEADMNKFIQIASRLGVSSGDRGIWQLPPRMD